MGKITIVAFLFVICVVSSLASVKKTDKPKPKNQDTTQFNKLDDTYVRFNQQLVLLAKGILKSIGYKVSSVQKTLKTLSAAKKGIKYCYNYKPRDQFNECAQKEMDKARLQFKEIEAAAHVKGKM